ncbi:MAG: amidohydrolase family protein [Dehalococcoidia bacterium]
MLVIDAHTHWRRDPGFVSIRFIARQASGRVDKAALFARPEVQTRYFDPDASKMIAYMDDAGVDMAMTCPVDYGLFLGEADMSIEEINACYPPMMERWPGRFVYYAGVDPRRPNAVALFKKALTEWGAQGLKLMPAAGFLPNDEICHPLYDLAMEYGASVIFHTGPKADMKSRLGHPFYVDDLAADYPDLNIVLGHVAGEWWRDAKTVMRGKRNCYGELAGWQRRFHEEPEQFFRDLGELRDAIGADHIMFGTDAPTQVSLRRFVDALKTLPESAGQYGVKFTAEEAEAIVGGNFARLHAIAVPPAPAVAERVAEPASARR